MPRVKASIACGDWPHLMQGWVACKDHARTACLAVRRRGRSPTRTSAAWFREQAASPCAEESRSPRGVHAGAPPQSKRSGRLRALPPLAAVGSRMRQSPGQHPKPHQLLVAGRRAADSALAAVARPASGAPPARDVPARQSCRRITRAHAHRAVAKTRPCLWRRAGPSSGSQSQRAALRSSAVGAFVSGSSSCSRYSGSPSAGSGSGSGSRGALRRRRACLVEFPRKSRRRACRRQRQARKQHHSGQPQRRRRRHGPHQAPHLCRHGPRRPVRHSRKPQQPREPHGKPKRGRQPPRETEQLPHLASLAGRQATPALSHERPQQHRQRRAERHHASPCHRGRPPRPGRQRQRRPGRRGRQGLPPQGGCKHGDRLVVQRGPPQQQGPVAGVRPGGIAESSAPCASASAGRGVGPSAAVAPLLQSSVVANPVGSRGVSRSGPSRLQRRAQRLSSSAHATCGRRRGPVGCNQAPS
mmetsp:Transcript_1205/g.4666  ORF Transcript_1205/g.4666 Transcript_1205/m.4666 type:complete len:471 (-) Transcript_1205:322-1734(-)